MITFFIALAVLILGYFIYGKIVEKLFGADPNRPTPATTMADGVDYVPMKPWRIFLIQFLNIAGVGPIIGAIMGAQFGTASFLWIVLGSIFAGAVHDYLAGMISLRDKGASLPEIHGTYLGNTAKQIMRGFTIILMILVGVVFVNTPATLLNAHFTPEWNKYIWIIIILVYYLIATLLPIDKLIGKIYPIFGILLLGMAVAIFVAFILYKPEIPELWSGMQNRHPDAANNPIFPMMFISIACGAISGFHATQSPLMARCMVNEKQGRPIFYGAMITEGVVALIWAAAAAYFFGPDSVVDVTGKSGAAIVGVIANTWFTPVIATITILGVISAAVTSGDTAMRSARLILSDFLHFDQKPIKNRLIIAIPLFAVAAAILVYSIADAKGFQVIWRYFAWANQVLATVTLWAITVYLWKSKGKHWYFFTFFPALFMTMVTGCFLFVAKAADGGLGSVLPRPVGYGIGAAITIIGLVTFLVWKKKNKRRPEMKKILFLIILAVGFASCSPVVHKKISKPMTPQESTVEVAVFEVNEMVPESAEIIGEIVIKDSGFTTDCDWETILEKAKTEVRAAGGNGLEILQHTYPNRSSGSSCHQIQANILNISDDIKPAELSEKAKENFHDYVILKEGDTTQCNIIDETKNYLTFIYEGQGTARRAVLPKDRIIAYHINDPVALAELQHERTKKKFNVRFGLEGGYAFRTARFADGLSNDYKDYLRKLTRGPVLGANVRFNVDNMYSIGIHYDRFMSSNSAYAYTYDEEGNYYEGIVSNDHAINFIAASFGYWGSFGKHRLFSEFLFGYMNYIDNGVQFGESYSMDGATFGMGFVVDYDYMLTEHVGIGAGASYYLGRLSKINVNGYEQNLGNNKEGLQRFNLKAGVRFYL